nr:ATP-binding protein [Deltaproteobacteria bacterium]
MGIPAIQDLIPRPLATNLSGLRCFSMPAKHDGEGARPRDPSPSSFSVCSPSPPSYRSIAVLTITLGLAARLASMPIDGLARRWGAEEKDIEQEVRPTPAGDQLPGAPTVVRRFGDAGHHAALSTLLEVLEAESDERGQRRTDRLLKASRLLPGRPSRRSTARGSRAASSQTRRNRVRASSSKRAANVLCFGLPGRGKTHAACALGHALVRQDTPSSTRPPSASCRISSPRSGPGPPARCRSSTRSTSSSSTTSATSSRARTRSRSSSP